MATQDISRHLYQPEKHYSGARLQKGRVILDSDFNEGEILDDESQRLVVVDVVGRHGSPNLGYSIGNVTKVPYDFTIGSGTYYLGGMRHEIGSSPGTTAPQTFRKQSNWLQANRPGVTLPSQPVGARNDLVYLVGWEQPVSATEDGELLEAALSGLDTSDRMRRMDRVLVATGTAGTCAAAFEGFVGTFIALNHAYDWASGELKSGARLTVSFEAVPTPDDLCSPAGNGYRGHENQAIRIQLFAPNMYLWSYDNAAPLFRVRASVTGSEVTVEFMTAPWQQEQFPLKGQVLEILPWGAQIANGERVADHRIDANIGGGVLARVTTSYNPRTKTLKASIEDATLLTNMLTWLGPVPEADRFLYLRVWNPGGPKPEGVDTYGTVFVPNDPAVALPGTGIKVAFNQVGIVGDYWIVAARPNTPEEVVPWALKTTGAAPSGPRRFYCPLAIVRWTLVGEALQVAAESCRRTFRPLTRLSGCCSVTVGDGATSHGDYTSIQQAILALPPNEPGKVCVLPGVYEERVHVVGRRNIVVEGCGPRTILRSPPGDTLSKAIFTLERCDDIQLRSFAVEAVGQFGIGVVGGVVAGSAAPVPSTRITLENLVVTTSRDATQDRPTVDDLAITDDIAAFPLCTVGAIGAIDLKILGCELTMIGDLSAAANVLLVASAQVVVRDCLIATPPGVAAISRAWGGLHIAGFCHDVLVERCEIREGLGHGITLGSVRRVPAAGGLPSTPPTTPPDNSSAVDPGGDCPGVGGGLSDFDAGDQASVRLLADLGPSDVRIYNNRIHKMGSSGISVLGFFPEEEGQVVKQIAASSLVIADNVIENNYAHPSERAPDEGLRAVVAFGGIVLADVERLRIHDNKVWNNGGDHRHPVCGIYVLHGENLVIENNDIRGNGPRVADDGGQSGHRAGIALQQVGRRVTPGERPSSFTVEAESGLPAARVRGNVVAQPAGRALQIYGVGPMFVEGNVLVSEGLVALSPDERRFAGHCVEIHNIGQSSELILLTSFPEFMTTFPRPALPRPISPEWTLHDGRVLFTNNQVRFSPVARAGLDVFSATRILSYGDVAVLGNQFFTSLAPDDGLLLHDTVVAGWSTRVTLNRWEDPPGRITRSGPHITTVSATTVGFMNVTSLNQATRCIHVYGLPENSDADSPIDDDNQVFDIEECTAMPPLAELFGP
ncbi:right-handed parallel beta-helix repeat-containing protein [Nannocystis pusilla]|uniref:right-handed parallel beta-helix repeat-containing protein n=1 Tax=Nannocystis pusilla TaxID=889268 RepID=UPI003BEFC434